MSLLASCKFKRVEQWVYVRDVLAQLAHLRAGWSCSWRMFGLSQTRAIDGTLMTSEEKNETSSPRLQHVDDHAVELSRYLW